MPEPDSESIPGDGIESTRGMPTHDIADVSANLAGVEPAEVIPIAHAPRFCTACGALFQPEWLSCEACAAIVKSRADFAAQSRAAAGSLHSPLGLYFVLLGLNLTGFLIGFWIVSDVWVETTIAILDSVIILIWSIVERRCFSGLFGRRLPVGWLAASAVIAIPTFLFAHFVVSLVRLWFDVPVEHYFEPYERFKYGWLWVILLVCVQPAVFEELAFRGVVLGSLRGIMNNREAILVSAFMFMILHLIPIMFPHTLLMGLVMGYLRIRTGSLYPCIVLHFVHNGLALLSEVYGY